jgi:hypothetical protein
LQKIYMNKRGKPESAKHWQYLCQFCLMNGPWKSKLPIWGNAWVMEPRNLETKQIGGTQIKRNGMLPVVLILNMYLIYIYIYIYLYHDFLPYTNDQTCNQFIQISCHLV